MEFHIGIDDTDSLSGGCTTYHAARLIERIARLNVEFTDYPNLVRLNPNIPWKTRGNGAIALRLTTDSEVIDEIEELVLDEIERETCMGEKGVDPAVAFLRGEVPEALRLFSETALTDVVSLRNAFKLARKLHIEVSAYGSGRGAVGALAAVGNLLLGDHTYELIAYRCPHKLGQPREIDPVSVREMDIRTRGLTFNNIDPETGRVLITPRGPDPILCGIRGESPEAVREAFRMLKIREKVERWVIFRCNHGTDAHLTKQLKISELKAHIPVSVEGRVKGRVRTIPGGHVIMRICDETGEVDCAAYEPTGRFRDVVRQLQDGDLVRAYGGTRAGSKLHRITINLEKLEIIQLAPRVELRNPLCDSCGKRMKSEGRNQGFQCEGCGARKPPGKTRTITSRNLSLGLYIPPPRAHRHLTKPESRYGKEKSISATRPIRLIPCWHNP